MKAPVKPSRKNQGTQGKRSETGIGIDGGRGRGKEKVMNFPQSDLLSFPGTGFDMC